MATARLWALRSTCSRLHVGAVVARDSRILATGYNGAPAGMPHCDHACHCGRLSSNTPHRQDCASLQPCLVSVHAEANAIAYAARHGISLDGAAIYTTHTPCRLCCMLIINSGIKIVVWKEDYTRDDGVTLLHDGNVAYGRFSAADAIDDMIDS